METGSIVELHLPIAAVKMQRETDRVGGMGT